MRQIDQIGLSGDYVTYEDVERAAKYLCSIGMSCTVESIRFVLGSNGDRKGSPNTIAPHLRAWKEERQREGQVTLGAPIPDQATHIMKEMWSALLEQARGMFHEEMAEAKSQFEAAEAESSEKLASLASERRDLLSQLDDLNHRYNITEAECDRLRQEVDSAVGREMESRVSLLSEIELLKNDMTRANEHNKAKLADAALRLSDANARTDEIRALAKRDEDRLTSENNRLLMAVDGERQKIKALEQAAKEQSKSLSEVSAQVLVQQAKLEAAEEIADRARETANEAQDRHAKETERLLADLERERESARASAAEAAKEKAVLISKVAALEGDALKKINEANK